MSERIERTARDNVAIVGDYYIPASPSASGLLLLHMMPADRTSWCAFAERAARAGFHVLAVDLRGHGESQGGPAGYQNFSDAEHQASRLDVEAGADFLKSKGVAEIFLGGASIGANLALGYLAEHPDARAAFLLSPGLNYRGVETLPLMNRIRPGQALHLAASGEDMRSSGQSAAAMAEELFRACPTEARKLKLFEGAGHGTTIFEREPWFMDELIAWLQKVALSNP